MSKSMTKGTYSCLACELIRAATEQDSWHLLSSPHPLNSIYIGRRRMVSCSYSSDNAAVCIHCARRKVACVPQGDGTHTELMHRGPCHWMEAGTRLYGNRILLDAKTASFKRPEYQGRTGLNIKVEPGQVVALVGASGCGKSTIVSLVERFYNPDSGTIYVNGRDISTIKLRDYRALVSLVNQGSTLFEGPLRDNVLLGVEDDAISEDVLIQACKDANIYDFIISLPEGFETPICGKGSTLLGGQKATVAIARALVRNPRILLMDEATSALDTSLEKIVQEALDRASQSRTTRVVAHRLSTVRNADAIFVLDAGEVVDVGNRSELMQLRGKYYELAKLQNMAEKS